MEKTSSPKHLVAWNKAEPVGKGRNMVYRSKCGRFEITKRYVASASSGRSGHFNKVSYVFVSPTTGKRYTEDLLEDAKLHADWEVDPNFEPPTKPLKG